MGGMFGDKTPAGQVRSEAVSSQSMAFIDRLAAPIVRLVDLFLRRRRGIFEFDTDERCLFRLSFHKTDSPHRWPDGTTVDAGTKLGELHLWQAHVAQLAEPKDFGSAAEFRRRLSYTLAALAHWTETDFRASELPGFFGDGWFGAEQYPAGIERALVRWGFTVDDAERPFGFWDELYAELLVRSFNPGKKHRAFRNIRVWMSRQELLRRYGTTANRSRSLGPSIDQKEFPPSPGARRLERKSWA